MLAASARGPGGSYRQNDDFYELAGVGPDRLVENLLIINLIIFGVYLHNVFRQLSLLSTNIRETRHVISIINPPGGDFILYSINFNTNKL